MNEAQNTILTRVIPNDVMMREIAVHIGEGRSVELLCRGNSMNPFLCDRKDSVILSPVTEDIRIGDVVLAKVRGGHFVLHRVCRLEPLTLNGDGNFSGSVEYVETVLAVMSGYVHKGKRGTVQDREWRRYSAFWALATKLKIGNWSLRRIVLGFWRRAHRDLVHKG